MATSSTAKKVEHTQNLETRVESLEKRLRLLEASSAGGAGSSSNARPASDQLLDGQWGNPEIKFDPPLWIKDGKQSYAGKKMSECAPDYLKAYARYTQWRKDNPKPEWDEKKLKNLDFEISKALGWAARNAHNWDDIKINP